MSDSLSGFFIKVAAPVVSGLLLTGVSWLIVTTESSSRKIESLEWHHGVLKNQIDQLDTKINQQTGEIKQRGGQLDRIETVSGQIKKETEAVKKEVKKSDDQ